MEKFTNWRDKGTGIAPFLPPNRERVSLGKSIFNIVIFVVKLVLVLPIIFTFLVTGGSNTVVQLVYRVLFGLTLDVSVQGVRRRQLRKTVHYPHNERTQTATGGRILLYMVNYTSVLDGIICGMISQGPAMFLIPCNNVIYCMTLLGFINFTMDGSLNVKRFGKECASVVDLPVEYVYYMFPEGTCSNGKSVLPFSIDERHLKTFLFGSMDQERSVPIQDVEMVPLQIKVNQSLSTPLAMGKLQYLATLINKKVNAKCKLQESVPLAPLGADTALAKVRIALNSGDKYKLVGRALDVESKAQFAQEFARR